MPPGTYFSDFFFQFCLGNLFASPCFADTILDDSPFSTETMSLSIVRDEQINILNTVVGIIKNLKLRRNFKGEKN